VPGGKVVTAARKSEGRTVRSGTARAALVALGLALGMGCGGRALPSPPDPEPMNRDTYVIGVQDVLKITVWKNPELDVTVPVRADGKVSVPLLDDVQAEGLTPEELKEVLTSSLAEYISSPHVTVIVLQMNSRTVAVMGAVNRNGSIPLGKDMRVTDAIATAGGFNTWARKSKIKILRRTKDGVVEYRFDYNAYHKGKAPGTNIVLMPGDTVIVPD